MLKKYQWIVRISFILFMCYIYATVYSENGVYSFLLLNTFLGYIPIELAMHITPRRSKAFFYSFFILWILFYPNAPYVLTDLFHLAMLDPYNHTTGLMEFNLHLWLNFTNLISSAIACSVMGIWSLEHISNSLLARFHLTKKIYKPLLILILTIVSSVGVYVGRFLRLHTAYLFFNPEWVVHQLVIMWSPRMLVFVGFMFIIQMILWGTIYIARLSLNSQKEDLL
ncbi:DUF1361 domain-containing protein [Liquorilactobacillus capillatus]|uniref:Uncharacterized protein n=1 Tax=Liquorilactobacillus capillatus DSM 19910 TaxID=1423731 RepID=A0A0R1M3P6_9LACO|nr:DUF1361 domain-containing protein [Liquorilactobacillus capillatus]KRL02663.1 hypothetical protein FC81_GL000550 [Liquorilactobacillus capillatus DSM 19910]